MRIVGIASGVDTHADTHVAAAVDHNGGLLGVESFPADQAGFEDLLVWLVGFGPVTRIGVEGTGSWGVGLSRFLADQNIEVVEVDRLNRQTRRRVGKSDSTDAVSAARAALSGAATVTPIWDTPRRKEGLNTRSTDFPISPVEEPRRSQPTSTPTTRLDRQNLPQTVAGLPSQRRPPLCVRGQRGEGKHALDRWLSWARRSQLESFIHLAKTIARHRQAIDAG